MFENLCTLFCCVCETLHIGICTSHLCLLPSLEQALMSTAKVSLSPICWPEYEYAICTLLAIYRFLEVKANFEPHVMQCN